MPQVVEKNGFVLWDIPTRFFHWAIVICVVLSWWSAQEQRYDLHYYSGCGVIVLVLFRLLWGFVGSQHSRFRDFLVGPKKLFHYLQSGEYASAGHNPLGAVSVVVFLSVLLLQAVSGLFNTDDILFSGPLHYSASTELRDTMGLLHDILFNVLLGLIALHIAAIAYHQLRFKERLIQAMLWGRSAGRQGTAGPVAWWPAVLLLVLLASGLWWLLQQAPQPEPFY